MKFKKNMELTLLVIPGIFLLILLCYVPMPGLVLAFRNTLAYNAVFMVTLIGLSLLLAILLNQIRNVKCLKTYQTAMFLPYFLSWSVVTYIVLALLDNSKGLVNVLMTSLGREKISFYFEPKYWPFLHVITLDMHGRYCPALLGEGVIQYETISRWLHENRPERSCFFEKYVIHCG